MFLNTAIYYVRWFVAQIAFFTRSYRLLDKEIEIKLNYVISYHWHIFRCQLGYVAAIIRRVPSHHFLQILILYKYLCEMAIIDRFFKILTHCCSLWSSKFSIWKISRFGPRLRVWSAISAQHWAVRPQFHNPQSACDTFDLVYSFRDLPTWLSQYWKRNLSSIKREWLPGKTCLHERMSPSARSSWAGANYRRLPGPPYFFILNIYLNNILI